MTSAIEELENKIRRIEKLIKQASNTGFSITTESPFISYMNGYQNGYKDALEWLKKTMKAFILKREGE